jgi:hypothetical protein
VTIWYSPLNSRISSSYDLSMIWRLDNAGPHFMNIYPVFTGFCFRIKNFHGNGFKGMNNGWILFDNRFHESCLMSTGSALTLVLIMRI